MSLEERFLIEIDIFILSKLLDVGGNGGEYDCTVCMFIHFSCLMCVAGKGKNRVVFEGIETITRNETNISYLCMYSCFFILIDDAPLSSWLKEANPRRWR